MEVGALFGRFVWRGVNIDDVTICPSRGSEDQSHIEAGLNNRRVPLQQLILYNRDLAE